MAGNDLNRSEPVIDFTSQDFASMNADLEAYAQATWSDRWTDFNLGQLAVLMRDTLSYNFDLGTFYMNGLLNETFVTTALRRQNLIKLGRSVEYSVPSASSATVVLELTLDPGESFPVTLLTATHSASNSGGDIISYVPAADTVIANALVNPVAVTFVEGTYVVGESLGSSDGAQAQRFLIGSGGVLFREPSNTLIVTVNAVSWTKYESLVDMGPSTTGYLVDQEESGDVFVVFGDGVNGKVPPITHVIEATYRYLADADARPADGNLGSDTITSIVAMPSAVLSLTNPNPASNGGPEPTNQQIRVAIPAATRVKSSAINALDIADAAKQVAGVAKAFSAPGDPLLRTILLAIAPAGGGQPSDLLKNQVLTSLRPIKLIGPRVAISGPVYKRLRIAILAHVAAGSQQQSVVAVLQSALTNTATGAGIFDYNQMEFRGVDEEDQPQVSVTVLQSVFEQIASKGLRRGEIEVLDVVPEARSLSSTTGDGTVTSIVTPTNDTLRREWAILFTSSTTFDVKERIVGQVTSISDAGITDDAQDFPTGLSGLGFTVLNPQRQVADTFVVSANTQTTITTTVSGMFLATAVGASYYVERSLGASGTVGVTYNALDAQAVNVLSFLVNAGASPWAAGDTLVIDTYPPAGDIDTLRGDEIALLDLADLTIRPAGGIQV